MDLKRSVLFRVSIPRWRIPTRLSCEPDASEYHRMRSAVWTTEGSESNAATYVTFYNFYCNASVVKVKH